MDNTISSDNTQTVYNLLAVIADIRTKTGVGDKPMLGELADTIGTEIDRLKRQVEVLRRVAQHLDENNSDPNDLIADGGITVWMGHRQHAKEALAAANNIAKE